MDRLPSPLVIVEGRGRGREVTRPPPQVITVAAVAAAAPRFGASVEGLGGLVLLVVHREAVKHRMLTTPNASTR